MQDSPLTSVEYAAYSVIFEADGITPTDFARTMGLPLTTALDHVRSMLKRRHIRKLRNPLDQRSYLLELTEAGIKAHRDARAHFARCITSPTATSCSTGPIRRRLAASWSPSTAFQSRRQSR